jgi:hypothetical protein
MYLVFSKATAINLNARMHPTNAGGWMMIWCIFIILLSIAKMDIFVCIKVALPSEFKCDYNEIIFSPIGHELGELRKFYKVFPEMEVFRAAPWVLQTAVINPIQSQFHPVF